MAESSQHEIKQQLHQMDPYRFEELVAELWELQGYETVVRQGSGDRGIDVEATKSFPSNEKVLIQAKRKQEGDNVDSKMVRNYATLYQQVPDADKVTIVTTSDVTRPGEQLSQDLDVEVITGDTLTEYIVTNDVDLSGYAQNIDDRFEGWRELEEKLIKAAKNEGNLTYDSGLVPLFSDDGPIPSINISYTDGSILSNWKGAKIGFAGMAFDDTNVGNICDVDDIDEKSNGIVVKIGKETDDDVECELRVIQQLANEADMNLDSISKHIDLM